VPGGDLSQSFRQLLEWNIPLAENAEELDHGIAHNVELLAQFVDLGLGRALLVQELCGNLGDDGLRKAAYRGG
jgi:hypothetical protein